MPHLLAAGRGHRKAFPVAGLLLGKTVEAPACVLAILAEAFTISIQQSFTIEHLLENRWCWAPSVVRAESCPETPPVIATMKSAVATGSDEFRRNRAHYLAC
jgi:hypothetical protein